MLPGREVRAKDLCPVVVSLNPATPSTRKMCSCRIMNVEKFELLLFFYVRPSDFLQSTLRSDMSWVDKSLHSSISLLQATFEVILLHPSRIW